MAPGKHLVRNREAATLTVVAETGRQPGMDPPSLENSQRAVYSDGRRSCWEKCVTVLSFRQNHNAPGGETSGKIFCDNTDCLLLRRFAHRVCLALVFMVLLLWLETVALIILAIRRVPS